LIIIRSEKAKRIWPVILFKNVSTPGSGRRLIMSKRSEIINHGIIDGRANPVWVSIYSFFVTSREFILLKYLCETPHNIHMNPVNIIRRTKTERVGISLNINIFLKTKASSSI
jgi:hypothetical protein